MADVGFSNDPDLREKIATNGQVDGRVSPRSDCTTLNQKTGDLEASLERLENEFCGENAVFSY